MKCFTALVLTLSLWQINCQVQLTEFQPYGTNHGDTNLASVIPNHSDLDDGSSPEVQLTTPLNFFAETFHSLWVNINGGVSFKGQIPTYTPACEPLDAEMAMITPFWADVDLRSDTGAVYYRQTSDRAVLDKAKVDIVKAYPNSHFDTLTLKWAFVATWVDVPFYDAVTACHHTGLSNTFQLTLTTDGEHSFAIFYYNKIQWTTGTASEAVGCTGRGGHSARAGFDNGQGKWAQISGSCSDAILNIYTRSNEGQAGKFVYQIDGGQIIDGTATLPTVTAPGTGSTVSPTHATGTTGTTLSDIFIDYRNDVLNDINSTAAEVKTLCMGLIDHPALQLDCFNQWIALDNRILEANKATTLDELRMVEKDLNTIIDNLDDLKTDIKGQTPAPPFVCASDDTRTKRRCDEVQKYLDVVYKLAESICPGLLDHPSVQKDCFNEWILVDNHISEIRYETKFDAFDLMFNDLVDIEKRLNKIKSDIGGYY